MKFCGTVALTFSAGAAQQRHVTGHFLAGGSPWQQPQKNFRVFPAWYDFLDPGDRHVDRRERRAVAAVAFVLDQYQGACLSHQEIGASDPHAGRGELVTQEAPGNLGELGDVVAFSHPQLVMKKRGHLAARLMNGWRKKVERRLAGQLHDEFTHVTFENLYAALAQELAERDLLGVHRLALDGN